MLQFEAVMTCCYSHFTEVPGNGTVDSVSRRASWLSPVLKVIDIMQTTSRDAAYAAHSVRRSIEDDASNQSISFCSAGSAA